MQPCETCKWWEATPIAWAGARSGLCRNDDVRVKLVKSTWGFYVMANFGCIYHQPKEADDE